MKASRIKYYPLLSVKENAKKNNCSEASIRLYIKENNIDRRGMEKARKIEICRKYYKSHKDTSRHKMSVETQISMSWITKYWEYITTKKKFTFFDNKKSKIHENKIVEKYFKPHPSTIRDVLREEQFSEYLRTYFQNKEYSQICEKCGYHVLASSKDKECDIIAIPYVTENLKQLITSSLKACKNKVAVLLPTSFLSGINRYNSIFSHFPPSKILIYINDVNIEKIDVNENKEEPLSQDNYSWYIFERQFKGSPTIKWIKNDTSIIFSDEDTKECYVLGGIKLIPNQWLRYKLKDSLIYHSYALPENRVLANHHNCIINLKGIEFYGIEQLITCMGYSDSPSMIRAIMSAKSCENVRTIAKDNKQNYNWDSPLKQYNVLALCYLYKYLTYKEYRDRLRELRYATIVESPNGKDDRYACIQNLDTNLLEGKNFGGRCTMIVRDMMLKLEDEAIELATTTKGSELTEIEREACIQTVCDKVRNKFDNSKEVIELTQKFIDIIEKYHIPKIKKLRPKPFEKVNIDFKSKCLILDFDNTIFDTSVDDKYRKGVKNRNWKKIYSLIPQYKLYDGWREVFEWLKANNVKIGILSCAQKELIERALEAHNIPYDAVVGYSNYYSKPNPILANILMAKLNVREQQILFVGDSLEDEKQARCSKIRFVAALWDSPNEKELREKGCEFISNPQEIFEILEK